MDSGRAGRQRPVSKSNAAVAWEDGPNLFERRFWPFACGVVLIWVMVRVFDFTLLPPVYKGLVITQPFYGLHSWDLATRSWAARSLVKYPLGYTKGLRTAVVGDPPPLIPKYYVSHPLLEPWILALGMLVFGTQDWSVRLFELVFSIPCLLLIVFLLRKLHGSACALLSGLILVLLPYSGYFGFSPLMVLLGLWALHRYLLLTGRINDGPTPKPRYLAELGVALFLLGQYNWVGIFYAFTIGLHYVLTCLLQRQVGWKILGAVALPSLVSLGLNFCIMFWGMKHNIALESPSPDSVLFKTGEHNTPLGLITTLYNWRASSGERGSFSWGDWVIQNWQYALTNFTAPLLIFLAAYLICLLLARGHALNRRLIAPAGAVVHTGPPGVLCSFPHLWFYVLPGLFFIFTFKGLMWQHQYWQSPFALFVAIGSALALLSVGEVLGQIRPWFGRSVMIALLLVVVGFCDRGLASYRAIRWHSPRTIALLKELNRRIPPDRALLTFQSFMTQQNKGKVATYRDEYAWHLDREMIVANAWKYDYLSAKAAQIDDLVQETVREVQGQGETGRYFYYLIPACEEYRHDPLRDQEQMQRILPGTAHELFVRENQQKTSADAKTTSRAGLTALSVAELDRLLRDAGPRDGMILTWEKHRRYREAVIAKLKELYEFEYYANTAQPGDEDFCYAGITPCYLFDFFRPK